MYVSAQIAYGSVQCDQYDSVNQPVARSSASTGLAFLTPLAQQRGGKAMPPSRHVRKSPVSVSEPNCLD